MLRAALAASPPDAAKRWVLPARLAALRQRPVCRAAGRGAVAGGAATGEPAVLRYQVGNQLAHLVVSAIAKPAPV